MYSKMMPHWVPTRDIGVAKHAQEAWVCRQVFVDLKFTDDILPPMHCEVPG